MDNQEIFIIYQVGVDKVYGIGTYINEYLFCLRRLNFKNTLIELGALSKEILITEENLVFGSIYFRASLRSVR